MYNGVHTAMVRSNVGIQLPGETMVTLRGSFTDNEEEGYGKKEHIYILNYPCEDTQNSTVLCPGCITAVSS
jgi:hypothetical protein